MSTDGAGETSGLPGSETPESDDSSYSDATPSPPPSPRLQLSATYIPLTTIDRDVVNDLHQIADGRATM